MVAAGTMSFFLAGRTFQSNERSRSDKTAPATPPTSANTSKECSFILEFSGQQTIRPALCGADDPRRTMPNLIVTGLWIEFKWSPEKG